MGGITQGITMAPDYRKRPAAIRIIAMAFCICFIVASLSATVFILTHANHNHDHNGPGGSCATCNHMIAAENLLKQLAPAVTGVALAFGSLFAVLSIFPPISFHISFYTLVNLKVRLNN
ncbi:MAG TPA: hypothetical protein DD811_12405 [Syntrophomonas sp.]|jgi:hypothetical protein|nr:hypothetical protein [Syntrophomonas sp.]